MTVETGRNRGREGAGQMLLGVGRAGKMLTDSGRSLYKVDTMIHICGIVTYKIHSTCRENIKCQVLMSHYFSFP